MSDEASGSSGGGRDNRKAPLWEKIASTILNAPWAAVLSIIVVVGAMAFVASVITAPGQHNDIRDTEYARGFITVLFGVGTIGIALLVTLSAIFLTDANAKERFDRGKEVLSLLLGIFGTIIGFYYGTGAQKTGLVTPAPTQSQSSTNPALSNVVPPGDRAVEANKSDDAGKALQRKGAEPTSK